MQDVVWNILGMISCALSIMGGAVILIAYYKLPELKTFGNKMIMYVGVSNIIYSIQTLLEFAFDLSELYNNNGFSTLCKIQGFISNYTSECMLIWITILSLTIHDTVKNRIVNMAKRERVFIFLGFIIPLLLSLIPFISDSYGEENGNCWITSRAGKLAEILQVWGLFYGQLWICIFLNFALILNTMKMLKALDIANTQTYLVIRRFLCYPSLWIICWVSGTVNRLIITTGGDNVDALMSISRVLTSSQGILTMVIFLSDKRILDAIKNRNQQYKNSQQNLQDQDIYDDDEECNTQKLLDPDDSDDYFSYYNDTKNTNQLNKNNTDLQNNNNLSCQTNDSNSSLIGKNNQQNQWGCVNPQNTSSCSSSLKLSSESCSSSNNDSHNQSLSRQQQLQQNQQQLQKSKRKNLRKRPVKKQISQKLQFQTSGQWNRMEQIDEDSDEENFDKEIQLQNISNPEQLFLSKSDTKILFKQKKVSSINTSEHSIKRQSE